MRGLGPFLRDAWRLGNPYFTRSEERWSARALLAAIIVLNLSAVGLTVMFNFWRADFYNALQVKDWHTFIQLLLVYHRTTDGLTIGFTVLAFTYITVAIYQVYLNQWLQIRWRRWLTSRYLDEWLADRAYYRIMLTTDRAAVGTDNPDQRIAEDLRDFTDYTLTLTLGLLRNVVSLFSFLTILWGLSGPIEIDGITIPGYLFWLALIYAILGTIATHFVGRPLASLNFRQQRVEADFRYSLVRLRENMEGVALYSGEEEEKQTLLHRFAAVIGNWRAIMTRTKLINMVVVGQGQAAAIFPTIIIAPRYFAGKVQLGQMFQTVEAFSQVLDSLSWIVNSYTNLANWRAIVERLATFHRAIVVARAAAAHGLILSPTPGDTVRLDDVTLTLPNGSALLQHTDLVLKQGTSIVVTGRSGSGKSTLFRALAGIWPFGDGRVERPVERCMFLPQRPYIPLGTLRHVITYPHPNNAYTREAITHALQDAGLGQFVPRLEHDDAWAQHLSGGEQQRVALARALLAKPDWLFLDEATANLDPESEAALYRTLKTRLPGTTLVSIAHRPSVAQFHDRRIVFQREEGKPGHLLLTELASAAEGGG